MANLPITSKVLKACHKGMKVRDPLLKVGTVTKQTTQRVNLNNQGGEAEFEKELRKSTDLIAGGNKTLEIDEAKDYGKVETDLDKYFKGLYKRFGNDVTTQELIDKKYISKDAADAYNKVTGGKNVGVKQPDKLVETEKEVDVLKKITPNTQENIGMSNFDARQQGRKSIQNARKLNKFERKMSKYGTFDEDGVFTANKGLSQKDMRKLRQFQSNRDNLLAMRDNIKTQTEQGSFGKNKYITDEFLTDNQKNFSAQLKQNEDGSLRTETPQEIYERNNPKTKDFKSVFENMAKDFAKKDFSINVSKNKPQTFFGSGDDKVTFKDIISGIGNNLVGDKSIFAKKDGGTDVGNTLRAINPFNKNDKPKTQTTSQVLDAVDFDGPPVQKKRKPLKKNYFKK